MVTTALCVAVVVLSILSIAMLVLMLRLAKEGNGWEEVAVKEAEKASQAASDIVVLQRNFDLSCREAHNTAAALDQDREILRARAQTLEAELDSQTQALVALCDAVGLSQEERLDIDLACERAETNRNRDGDLCEIARMLGVEPDSELRSLQPVIADLIDKKGKLGAYRAAIDKALGGVRTDGQSWTQAHVPVIESLVLKAGQLKAIHTTLGIEEEAFALPLVDAIAARSALLGEVEAALSVHPFDDTLAAVKKLVEEHDHRGDLIRNFQDNRARVSLAVGCEPTSGIREPDGASYVQAVEEVARDAALYRSIVASTKAAQQQAQEVIDQSRRAERVVDPDSVIAIQARDGVLL